MTFLHGEVIFLWFLCIGSALISIHVNVIINIREAIARWSDKDLGDEPELRDAAKEYLAKDNTNWYLHRAILGIIFGYSATRLTILAYKGIPV